MLDDIPLGEEVLYEAILTAGPPPASIRDLTVLLRRMRSDFAGYHVDVGENGASRWSSPEAGVVVADANFRVDESSSLSKLHAQMILEIAAFLPCRSLCFSFCIVNQSINIVVAQLLQKWKHLA